MKVDLCIVGGGSGGLSVAAGAAQLGISVALIENNKHTFTHTLFPVPAKNYINISLTLEQTTTLELSIYDLSGKLIYRNPANAYQPGKNLIRVNTGSLASGSYYYKIHAGKQQMGSGKFIVE